MKQYLHRLLFNFICIAVILCSSKTVTSQNYKAKYLRDSLNYYFNSISVEKNDDRKLMLNQNILRILRENLSNSNSFYSPLDSLNYIGLIKSTDNNLLIYTWNIPFNDGTHKYFGFLHYYSKNQERPLLFELNDKSAEIKNPEFQILSDKNWNGSLIYKVLVSKYKSQVYYTLLSSDLNDLMTKKKCIDILHFNENELPVFGARIFQNFPRNTRVIFEYNVRANMTLSFNENLNMIVFDHLSPSKPNLTGIYEFYGPDFSYDGYKFEQGKWIHYPDIDVRNNKN